MKQTDLELDLEKLIHAVRRNFWYLLLAAILSVGITLVVTYFFVIPQYQSATILHVRNTQYVEDLEGNIDVIAKLRDSLLEILKSTEVHRTHGELEKMISVSSVDNTEFVRLVVTSPDPYEAEIIANAAGSILPQRISAILEGSTVKVVEEAIVAREPSSPNYVSNAFLGLVIGLMPALGTVLLREFRKEKEKIRSS